MKKLLAIIVLGLLFSGNAYASKIGKGNIQFNDEVTKNFKSIRQAAKYYNIHPSTAASRLANGLSPMKAFKI